MAFDMSDYVDVSERLANLFAKHPDASMRGTYDVLTIGTDTFIAYRAECYRTADDAAPGVGTAWEPVPGKTTFTKGSELQNAETSAWGRAIVAVGASESKRIASANEVRNAQANQNAGGRALGGSPTAESDSVPKDEPRPPAPSAGRARVQTLQSKLIAMQADGFKVASHRKRLDLPPLNDDCTDDDLDRWMVLLNEQDGNLQRENVA